jgi:hypothetical protein
MMFQTFARVLIFWEMKEICCRHLIIHASSFPIYQFGHFRLMSRRINDSTRQRMFLENKTNLSMSRHDSQGRAFPRNDMCGRHASLTDVTRWITLSKQREML